MHESGLVRDLVRRVAAVAGREGAKRVTGVSVWVGALTQFSAEHFAEHFAEDAAGGIAEGALLEIEVSTDLAHPQAQAVLLREVRVED